MAFWLPGLKQGRAMYGSAHTPVTTGSNISGKGVGG